MLKVESTSTDMFMPAQEGQNVDYEQLMQDQREDAFWNASRNLKSMAAHELRASEAKQEITDLQAQMDSMPKDQPKGHLVLKKEEATKKLNNNKSMTEVSANGAITQYAFWKGIKLDVQYLSGIGKDGTMHKAIRYTVDGDDERGSLTSQFFVEFDKFVDQHKAWIAGENGFVRPADWPKERDEEAIAKRERAKRPLNPELLIQADQDTVLESAAALEATEYFLVGLMLSSSFNSKYFVLGQKNLRLKSSIDLEQKLSEIRQTLAHKDAVDDLSSNDVILLRDAALAKAGHHLTVLRNANLVPNGINARNSKGFLQQIRKTLSYVEWDLERKANIDLLRHIILNTREYNQKAGNIGGTTLSHEIA